MNFTGRQVEGNVNTVCIILLILDNITSLVEKTLNIAVEKDASLSLFHIQTVILQLLRVESELDKCKLCFLQGGARPHMRRKIRILQSG